MFAVIAANFSLQALHSEPKSNQLWKINMTAFDGGAPAAQVASKLADLPNAGTLNGLAASSPDGSTLLATDSVAGNLFAIDTNAGSGRTVLNSTELQATNPQGAPLAANGINNLPAYLALEPTVADAPARLAALLVGVNTGPIVTMWGSVATLLWAQRCRSAGLAVDAGRVARTGLLCAVVVVGATTLTLAATA